MPLGREQPWTAWFEQLPASSDDPVDRLRHTLAAHVSEDAEDRAVTAAVQPALGVNTGLTWGDLRALLAIVEGQAS